MNNKRRILGIVGALLLAIVGTVALVGYVNTAKDEAVSQEELVDVYVVEDLVPKGADPETIKSSVVIEQVPARLKQTGAITELDAVGDMVAATDLQPGDQLVAARLVPRAAVSVEVTDKVQISALLEAERAVGGALQKGDLVGVYLSFDPFELDEAGQEDESADSEVDPDINAAAAAEGGTSAEAAAAPTKKTPNVSRLEFQHVLVTNVQTTSTPVTAINGDDEEVTIAQVSGTQYVVTLALSPEQSERFVFATEFGHVWLSMQPASVSDDGTRIVTLGNVYSVVVK